MTKMDKTWKNKNKAVLVWRTRGGEGLLWRLLYIVVLVVKLTKIEFKIGSNL